MSQRITLEWLWESLLELPVYLDDMIMNDQCNRLTLLFRNIAPRWSGLFVMPAGENKMGRLINWPTGEGQDLLFQEDYRVLFIFLICMTGAGDPIPLFLNESKRRLSLNPNNISHWVYRIAKIEVDLETTITALEWWNLPIPQPLIDLLRFSNVTKTTGQSDQKGQEAGTNDAMTTVLQESLGAYSSPLQKVNEPCPMPEIETKVLGVGNEANEHIVIKMKAEGADEKIIARVLKERGCSYAQIGRLLPATPGYSTGYEAQKKRGQRLLDKA